MNAIDGLNFEADRTGGSGFCESQRLEDLAQASREAVEAGSSVSLIPAIPSDSAEARHDEEKMATLSLLPFFEANWPKAKTNAICSSWFKYISVAASLRGGVINSNVTTGSLEKSR